MIRLLIARLLITLLGPGTLVVAPYLATVRTDHVISMAALGLYGAVLYAAFLIVLYSPARKAR